MLIKLYRTADSVSFCGLLFFEISESLLDLSGEGHLIPHEIHIATAKAANASSSTAFRRNRALSEHLRPSTDTHMSAIKNAMV